MSVCKLFSSLVSLSNYQYYINGIVRKHNLTTVIKLKYGKFSHKNPMPFNSYLANTKK